MNRDIIKKIKEGRNLKKGFFTLMWDICAQNIKNAIDKDANRVISVYHNPNINNVEVDTLAAPTKFLKTSEYP